MNGDNNEIVFVFDDLFEFPAQLPFEVDDIDEVVFGWFPDCTVDRQYAYEMYEEAKKRWREYPGLVRENETLRKKLQEKEQK